MRVYPLASIQGFGRIDSLRILPPCSIVRADLTSCWRGAVGVTGAGRTYEGHPFLTE